MSLRTNVSGERTWNLPQQECRHRAESAHRRGDGPTLWPELVALIAER